MKKDFVLADLLCEAGISKDINATFIKSESPSCYSQTEYFWYSLIFCTVLKNSKQDLHWELWGCINLPCCLYSFQKLQAVVPAFHCAYQQELGHILSLSVPIHPLPAPSPEVFMLEMLPIQLVTLPVYVTPLCKNTKRRLESGAVYLYWPPATCMFLTSKERSQSKACLNSWGIQRAQKPTFSLPQTSHPETEMTACLNMQLLHYFSVLCLVTFCLPYSEEVRVGESENSGLLKPALCNLHSEPTSLLSPCYPLLCWWPATSSCVLAGSDLHQWLGRHPAGAQPLTAAAEGGHLIVLQL